MPLRGGNASAPFEWCAVRAGGGGAAVAFGMGIIYQSNPRNTGSVGSCESSSGRSSATSPGRLLATLLTPRFEDRIVHDRNEVDGFPRREAK